MPEAKDPYRYFRLEARDLVSGLQAGALELERGGSPRETVGRLLRLAHTLKGAARVVRLDAIAEVAHRIEDLLGPARESGAVGQELVSALLTAVDAIESHLAALDRPAQPAAAEPRAPAPARTGELDTLRVSLTELDRLLDGLLDLRAGLVAGLDRAGLDRGLSRLQAQLSELRLVPAGVMSANLERLARDTAVAAGRQVELVASGSDVRLDAPVLVAVQEAMVQVVRNAVAHGIEPPERRRRAGKPAVGRIALHVERESSRVRVRCADDGQGIDLERVRGTALARGLIGAEEASGLDLDRALGLLLRGGLSTAEGTTQVAGRGVGLDVVRDAMDRVAGEVSIRSEPGRGTEVSLSVPVSLAALDALEVEVGGERMLIPLDGVAGCRWAGPEELAPGARLVHAGEPVDHVPLAALLGLPEARTARERGGTVVILRAAEGALAARVDHLGGVTRVVLRALPPRAGRLPLLAGACLSAEGVPLLVLDPAALVEAARTLAARPVEVEAPRLPLLVIDDSLTTRMLEHGILTAAGWQVDLASSAEEGLLRLRGRRYGLCLVDVEMPGMDGYELVATVRRDPQLRALPCVLVTSRGSPADKQRGLSAGADAYVVKSEFQERGLLDLVARLTGTGAATA